MDLAFLLITYSLVSILYLCSAGLTFPLFRLPAYRRSMIGFFTADLFLAGIFMYGIYRIAIEQGTIFESSPILIMSFGSGLFSVAGTFFLRRKLPKAEEDHRAEQAAVEELKTSLNIYKQNLETSPQPMAIKDGQGRYISCNPAYADFVNLKVEDLVGKSDDLFLSVEQANYSRRIEEKVIASGQPYVEETQSSLRDRQLSYRISRSLFRDIHGDAAGILISVTDHSDLKDLKSETIRWQKSASALAEAEGSLARSPLSTLESSAFFEQVLNLYASLAGTANVGLWQVSTEPLSALFIQGLGKTSHLKGIRLRPGEDIIGKVLQNGKTLAVPEYQGGQGALRWPRDIHFCTALGLPIRNKDQVVSIISIFWEQPGCAFSSELINSLEVFSHSVSANFANWAQYKDLSAELSDWQKKVAVIQYRIRLEHVIAMIASHFIGLPAEKVDEGIVHSLQTISKIAGIDRCCLVLFAREGISELTQPVKYINLQNGVKRGWEPILKEEEKWYPLKVNQGEVVYIPRVSSVAEDEDGDTAVLRDKGIKSYSAVPLIANRSVIGYLGFETLRTEVDWTPEVIALLKVAADMFVNLLEKKWNAMSQQDIQEKLNQKIRALELNNQENILLTQMGDLLQACRTSDEAYPIITRFIQRLIPDSSGALYIIQDAKDPAEKVAEWGITAPAVIEHELIQNECWSFRRGRAYSVEDPSAEPVCGHIKEPIVNGYMCVPLNAHGVAVGVLHIRGIKKSDRAVSFSEAQQLLANRVAEYIAMPLTNLRLRDELRSQAIRDPLTKLFNRRYMEETLDREIRRAIRHQTAVGIIMFDIDKMKPINDRFGHDAGDLLLRTMGRELLGMFRGEDVACRYGGDEFTIVLPEAGLAEVWRRAEQMREAVKRLNLVYDGKLLGQVSLSIGVAAFPEHGQNAEKVILAADAASYASKIEGGDRIMMGRKTDN